MARQCHRATHLASRRHRTARLESRSRQTVPFGVLPRVLSRLLVGAGRHATCLASSLSVVVLSSASARFRHAFAWSAWMRSLECQPRHDSVTIGCFVSFTVYHVWHRAMCDMSFNIDHSMSHEHPVKGKYNQENQKWKYTCIYSRDKLHSFGTIRASGLTSINLSHLLHLFDYVWCSSGTG